MLHLLYHLLKDAFTVTFVVAGIIPNWSNGSKACFYSSPLSQKQGMSLQALGMSRQYRCCRKTLVAGFLCSSPIHSLSQLLLFHTFNSFNQQINKFEPIDNGNCGQKYQKAAFIISGSLAISLSYPVNSGYARSCKGHRAADKENAPSEISCQLLQGKGWFCFLRKKRRNVLEPSLSRLKSKTFTRLRSKKAHR